MVKHFGRFEFDDQRRVLSAEGRPVRLSGQALDLLCLLLRRPGELITRDEIERALWPDRHVHFDHSLDVVVSRLRTVLGDKESNARFIETVPRRGYRFVERVTASRQAPVPRRWMRRLVRYAAVAILAAIIAIFFVRSRYDKFVPGGRSHMSTAPQRQN